MRIAKKIVLRFPPDLVDKPILYRLAKDYDLEFNVLRASVTPKEEGLLVLELSGESRAYDKAIRFLRETGVEVRPLVQDVTRLEERCTHCGACITICPVSAFTIHHVTREVSFADDKCIACELCLSGCPVRAMQMRL
jgi:ferredoxin